MSDKEAKAVLSFIESNMDKHEVDVLDIDYTLSNEVNANEIRDRESLETIGLTKTRIEFSITYEFEYEE